MKTSLTIDYDLLDSVDQRPLATESRAALTLDCKLWHFYSLYLMLHNSGIEIKIEICI